MIESYIGFPYGTNIPIQTINSPYYHAHSKCPPTYFLHGSYDNYVDINDSRNLHKKLDSLSVLNYLDETLNDHGTIMYLPKSKYELMATWIKNIVK